MIHSLLAALASFSQAPQTEPARPQQPPATVAPQAESPAPSEGRAPANGRPAATVDSVQLIVNEDCITIVDLQRTAAQKGKPATTREEYARMLQESVEQLVRNFLKQQAGQVLGYDKAMIDAVVRDEMDRQRDRFGSVAALAEELDRSSFSSAQLKEDTENYIHRKFWELAVTGRQQGPGGRIYVDRYVRPGLLLLEFKNQGSRLDMPAKVQLEEMIIAPALGESPEQARQKAQLVRSRLAHGEDFYELNNAFGLPGRDPELAPIEESKLALMPEAKVFVDHAAPGDFSEVISIVRGGQLAGFRILRFVGRQEGRAASFVDREFQDQIRAAVQERWDKWNEERALRGLLDAAYVWPPELSARARRTQEALEPAAEPSETQPTAEPATPPTDR
jgi:hypothetical protein